MTQLDLLNRDGTVSSLAIARQERDDGMQRALDHAEADDHRWGAKALEYLHGYCLTHDRFPGWFVTASAGLTKSVPVRSGKAWGSVFTKAARLGWIVKDGVTQDPNRHANPAPVWRSLLYREAA